MRDSGSARGTTGLCSLNGRTARYVSRISIKPTKGGRGEEEERKTGKRNEKDVREGGLVAAAACLRVQASSADSRFEVISVLLCQLLVTWCQDVTPPAGANDPAGDGSRGQA